MKQKYKNIRTHEPAFNRLKINAIKAGYPTLIDYIDELSKVKLPKRVINTLDK